TSSETEGSSLSSFEKSDSSSAVIRTGRSSRSCTCIENWRSLSMSILMRPSPPASRQAPLHCRSLRLPPRVSPTPKTQQSAQVAALRAFLLMAHLAFCNASHRTPNRAHQTTPSALESDSYPLQATEVQLSEKHWFSFPL